MLEDKVKPIGDRILVQRVLPPEKIGAIFIPTNKAKERLMKYKILAVGDGEEASRFIVGEIVLISWFIGVPVDIVDETTASDENYKIVTPDNIVGYFNG